MPARESYDACGRMGPVYHCRRRARPSTVLDAEVPADPQRRSMKPADPKLTAGRAFVRSLNILLKFARLYGFDHVRTTELLDVAFRELRAAIPAGTEAGLLLGATGNQLLLDGVPLEGSPAEKQFAQLLSSAGLASVQFFPSITQDELTLFARAFPTGKAKPSELAEQLKASLVWRKGCSHQRNLLRRYGLALPRCQSRRAARRRNARRRSGRIQAVAQRPAKTPGDDRCGAGCPQRTCRRWRERLRFRFRRWLAQGITRHAFRRRFRRWHWHRRRQLLLSRWFCGIGCWQQQRRTDARSGPQFLHRPGSRSLDRNFRRSIGRRTWHIRCAANRRHRQLQARTRRS